MWWIRQELLNRKHMWRQVLCHSVQKTNVSFMNCFSLFWSSGLMAHANVLLYYLVFWVFIFILKFCFTVPAPSTSTLNQAQSNMTPGVIDLVIPELSSAVPALDEGNLLFILSVYTYSIFIYLFIIYFFIYFSFCCNICLPCRAADCGGRIWEHFGGVSMHCQ